MNKRNLIIFLAVILAAAAVVAGIIIVASLPAPQPPDDPDSTTAPPDRQELLERFGDFSSITVTVGENPKTTANITWQSMVPDLTGYVKFYEKGAAEGTVKVTAVSSDTVFDVPVSGQYDFKNPQLEEAKGQVHRCYLEGLKPGTEYVFVAGYEGRGESEEKSFKTAADSDNFSFVIIADTQGFTKRNYDVFENLAKAAAETLPEYDFVIHMGDAVEEGKNHYQWQLYFNAAEKLTAGRSVIDVAGNRDKKHTLLHYTNGSSENRTALVSGYYSFDWGNLHFAVLNTGDGDKDLPKSQLKWLASDLAAAKGKTRIILMHKAPYTNANHCSDSEIVAMRAQVLPIAAEYGVAAVISGHDHYYFRSKPVDGEGKEAPCETVSIDTNGKTIDLMRSSGTVYFVNGSAGVKQHDDPIKSLDEIVSAKAMLIPGPTVSHVTVDRQKMVFTTYLYDNGSLKEIDSFGLYID